MSYQKERIEPVNPACFIRTNPDYSMQLFQRLAGFDLGSARESIAKRIAQQLSSAGECSIGDLVNAWKSEACLFDFTVAVQQSCQNLKGI